MPAPIRAPMTPPVAAPAPAPARAATIGPAITRFIPGKWPIKGLRLDFNAYNVLIIKKWVDNIDPETVGYGVDSMVGLESPGVPSTRSLGLNLNIKF